ncbi:12025_t:CDS:2 [Entrophospora sp. SA101]|nr:12025_t:CDS:2 [Entrophospora sp. SA101]
MAFRRSKIWFTNLFASLCRRPQFLGSLQLILRSLHVISHTEDHEHHLEIKRMEKVDPKSRIISADEESLKLQIKSVQDEKERLNSFLFEFVDSKKKNPGKYKANSLKEPLWKLTTNLLDLFENFDSNMTHHLIEKAPELTTDGFNSLFNSYDIGKRRMETLLNQEVYGTGEINTIGRRSTNRKEKLEENIEATERPSNFKNNPIDLSVPIEEGESSNKRRRTTEHEHSILDPLVEMYTKPTKDQINRAIEKTRWDRKRVLGYVDKHRKKKETQQQ